MANNGIHTIQEFFSNLQKKGRLLDHRFGITITKSGFEDIHLYGQSTTIPRRKINTAEVEYFGQKFPIPTTIDEGQSWAIKASADADNDIYNRFREWQEVHASWAKSGGGSKTVSNVNAYIDIYNANMDKIVDTFCLKGIFPDDVGDIDLDMSGDGIVTFDVNFVFILCYNSKRGTDPLR